MSEPEEMIIVKFTSTWVVEVPKNTAPRSVLDWDPQMVKAATDLCDGCSWGYEKLDRDKLHFSDANALKVWQQYRDGVRVK